MTDLIRTPPLVHHVFFWLKNPESKQDRLDLIKGIQTLAGIDGVLGLHIGEPAPTENRDVVDASYAITELMFFDSHESEKHYQEHPIHQAFIEQHSHLWSEVKVYDSIEIASSNL